MNALMQLVDFRVFSLEITGAESDADYTFPITLDDFAFNIDFNVYRHREAPEFFVKLKIECVKPRDAVHPLEKIRIETGGVFTFPEGTEEEKIHQHVPLLCLTNLYGISRGAIINATGSFHTGPFILPLINMGEYLKAHAVSGKAAPKTQKKKKAKKPGS